MAEELLQYPIPKNGMAVDISPNNMSSDFSPYVNNFIFSKLGELKIRNGVKVVNDGSSLPKYVIIKKLWSSPVNKNELVALVIEPKKFDTEYTIEAESKEKIKLTGAEQTEEFPEDVKKQFTEAFPIDFDIYLELNEVEEYSKAKVSKIEFNLVDNYPVICISLSREIDALTDKQITGIYFESAALYRYDDANKWRLLKNNLAADTIYRAVDFDRKLIIANGVDPMMVYDSEGVRIIEDYVKIKTDPGSDITANIVGNVLTISLRISTVQFNNINVGDILIIKQKQVEVTAKAQVDKVASLTCTKGELTPEEVTKIQNVFIIRRPPLTNYLYNHRGFLYGLGSGKARIEGRENREESLRVYRTAISGDYTRWIDESTLDYNYVDTATVHGCDDDLECISEIDDKLLFFGNKRTQVWKPDYEKEKFGTHIMMLECGVMHGNLVWKVANDVYFMGAGGIQSIGTINVGLKPAVSTIGLMNSEFAENLGKLYKDRKMYLYIDVCNNHRRNFVLINLFGTNQYCVGYSSIIDFFSYFSSSILFSKDTFSVMQGNKMYFADKKIIYLYKDGSDGEAEKYSDENQVVNADWYCPINNNYNAYWFNYRVGIDLYYTKAFEEDNSSEITVTLKENTVNKTSATIKFPIAPENTLLRSRTREINEETEEEKQNAGLEFSNRIWRKLSVYLKMPIFKGFLQFQIKTKSAISIKGVNLIGRFTERKI